MNFVFGRVLELPLPMASVSPDMELRIEVLGYQLRFETAFKLFEPLFEIPRFRSGPHTVNMGSAELRIHVYPDPGYSIVYLPDRQLVSTKRSYFPILEKPVLTLQDF